MKSFILSSSALLFALFAAEKGGVSAQAATSSQICAQINQFTTCTNTAANQGAACSNLVVSTPTRAYYQCICEGYKAQVACYSLCPDDVMMQAQLQAILSQQQASCNLVSQFDANNPTPTPTAPPGGAAPTPGAAPSTPGGSASPSGPASPPAFSNKQPVPPPLNQTTPSNPYGNFNFASGADVGAGALAMSNLALIPVLIFAWLAL